MSEELKGSFALPWFADETRYQRDFRTCRNIWAGNNFVAAVEASQHGVDLAASIVEAVNSYPELTTLRAENEMRTAELDFAVEKMAAYRSENEILREAVKVADDAINEMFRYFDGGETRGSYDGKPERAQLRKAGYATRNALSRVVK